MAHDSIKTLLDSLERKGNRRLTHSELARALNVSEQVITNWAKRGISTEGALNAQFAFHTDANFILGRISHPMMLPRSIEAATPAQALAREAVAPYLIAPAWPFEHITPKQWADLDIPSKRLVEALVMKMAPA